MPWSCTPRMRRAQVDSGRDVAPLVAPAGLQLAAVMFVEVDEIVGLEQHVAELGITQAGVGPFQPRLDRIFGQHDIDGKMLADVAQEFEVAEAAHPIVVVDQQGRGRTAVEIEEPPQLLFHAGNIGAEDLDVQEVTLFALAAGVADHARRPAHQGQRPMPGLLETAEEHDGHEISHVHAVGGGVEADVNRTSLLLEPRLEIGVVGGLVDQFAPAEFSENVRHGGTKDEG